MIIHYFKSLTGYKTLNRKEMFTISVTSVIFFAILYYISDYGLEQQRREDDKHHEHQNLDFIDYFQFSLMTQITMSDSGQRFSRVDWTWNTRYINICQMLILLYMVLFI